MSARPLKDVAASVRQRLLNRAQERGEDFQLTLIHYSLERLLYRLSRSRFRDRFVLKGAMLFSVWGEVPYRATRDLDLLGRGDNSVEDLEAAFREICQTDVKNHGLEFMINSIHGEEIAEDQEYQGVRLSFEAKLAGARIPIQVDVGFGDTIKPNPETLQYPTMLDYPAPTLLSYPREAVVAEKYHAMVVLGIANSRMKDFYDVWYLAEHFSFDGGRLGQSIQATFDRRRTALPPEAPICLGTEFSDDRSKGMQWQAFLRRTGVRDTALGLADVIQVLRSFLWPVTTALVGKKSFENTWPGRGPWQPKAAVRRRSQQRHFRKKL